MFFDFVPLSLLQLIVRDSKLLFGEDVMGHLFMPMYTGGMS